MLVLRRSLFHWALGGLVIEKSFSITEAGPKFDVRVNIRNESPNVRDFSYWQHNCFRIGSTPTLPFTTKEGKQTFSGDQRPREIWAHRSGIPREKLDLLREPNAPSLTESSFALGSPTGPHIVINAEPSALLQLYRWWDGTRRGRYTLEWIYQKQELRTGQMWSTLFSVEIGNIGESKA